MYILKILESLPRRSDIAISHVSLHAVISIPDPIEPLAPPPSSRLYSVQVQLFTSLAWQAFRTLRN